MLPKVLVFTPIYEAKDYCLKDFIAHSKKLTYGNKRHIFIDNSQGREYFTKLKRMGLDVFHVDRGDNSRQALAAAQNKARSIALEGDYDYMFSLESDIFPPEDIIERLMMHVKPVITGLYFIGPQTNVPCITLPEYQESIKAFGTRLLKVDEFRDYIRKGLKRVAAGGFGTALIRRDIFEKTNFTYDYRFQGHSDIYFFNWCFNNKVPVYVDTDIVCEHKNSDWKEVKDR